MPVPIPVPAPKPPGAPPPNPPWAVPTPPPIPPTPPPKPAPAPAPVPEPKPPGAEPAPEPGPKPPTPLAVVFESTPTGAFFPAQPASASEATVAIRAKRSAAMRMGDLLDLSISKCRKKKSSCFWFVESHNVSSGRGVRPARFIGRYPWPYRINGPHAGSEAGPGVCTRCSLPPLISTV